MQVQQMCDECRARSEELEKALSEAELRWKRLEARLDETEETFLWDRVDAWKKWFTLEESELSSWIKGGLRSAIRDRIQSLLVSPLTDRMQQRVGFAVSSASPPNSCGEPNDDEELEVIPQASWQSANPVLNSMLQYWERAIKPVLDVARLADDRLCKKIKKTEKDERAKGIVALGMHDSRKVASLKRERPPIWEPVQKALEKLTMPVRRLSAFFSDEVSTDTVSRLCGAIPTVAGRAVCDWYFQKCLADHDQLGKWWEKTKAALQQRANVWRCLMGEEGVLLRRIEVGLADVDARRRRYAIFANFGGTDIEVMNLLSSLGAQPTPEAQQRAEESLQLLASVASEMYSRLRQIRDSAMWRVIDATQAIHKQLCLDGSIQEVPPWEATGADEGRTALLEMLGGGDDSLGGPKLDVDLVDEAGLVDVVMIIMRRLERIATLVTELKLYLVSEMSADSEYDVAVFDELTEGIVGINEELLALMDDPSVDSAHEWVETWDHRLCEASFGERLNSTMLSLPLKRDSELKKNARHTRRKWLVLAKGLLAFLDDGSLRAQAIWPLAKHSLDGGPGGGRCGEDEVPPAECVPAPPGRPRPSPCLADACAGDETDLSWLSAPPSPWWSASETPLPNANYVRRPSRQLSSSRLSSQMQEVGMPTGTLSTSFIAPWRPDTPSTACEEAVDSKGNLSPMFVDGHYATLRSSSSAKRLPPLSTPQAQQQLPWQAW